MTYLPQPQGAPSAHVFDLCQQNHQDVPNTHEPSYPSNNESSTAHLTPIEPLESIAYDHCQ
eukprot:8079622-Karenia_brevis.AAC.1